MPCFQMKNKRTGRYQKYKELKNGKLKITNVKERNPSQPFAGVKIKRRS